MYGQQPNLDELFKPLHKTEGFRDPGYFTDYKARGYVAPWVRIYAIKLDSNLYVITGFGIKMVKQMKEDPLLNRELEKLRKASSFLQSEGLLD